jgi:hypothetical protein
MSETSMACDHAAPETGVESPRVVTSLEEQPSLVESDSTRILDILAAQPAAEKLWKQLVISNVASRMDWDNAGSLGMPSWKPFVSHSSNEDLSWVRCLTCGRLHAEEDCVLWALDEMWAKYSNRFNYQHTGERFQHWFSTLENHQQAALMTADLARISWSQAREKQKAS